MSVLNNLAKKYLEEEKFKAKDKFTFIFQSQKDEDIDIKQLQTAKVYHVIDEPQFNDIEGNNSKLYSRLNTGLEQTINGIKKSRQMAIDKTLKNQQVSEQQIQRQQQFEKKGKEIRENMVQKKKDKVNKMKINSENKFQEQEKIAKSVIDIHKKGHLVYVDYGEDSNVGFNGVKEYKSSPKHTDLEAIAYSKIIEKTQEFLDQEEVYKQIKKDLRFKFNFATDKTEKTEMSTEEHLPYPNSTNHQIRDKSASPASEKKSNNKDKQPNIISLVEGDINVNLTADQKKKIDKDLFKYLKSESTNYLIERDNVGESTKNGKIKGQGSGSTSPDKQQQKELIAKNSSKPPKVLKNSNSVNQGKTGDKSGLFIMKENSSAIRLIDESSIAGNENHNQNEDLEQFTNPMEICQTETNERQQVKVPLRSTRSQMTNNSMMRRHQSESQNQQNGNSQQYIQIEQLNQQYSSLIDQQQKQLLQNNIQYASHKESSQNTNSRQNLENSKTLHNLVSQKTKIQNKIAQQKIKFDELLTQIQYVTNNKGDKSVSASVDFSEINRNKNKIEPVDIKLMSNIRKVNENQISVNMEFPNNTNSNNTMHGVKLPQINGNTSNLQNYQSYLNQENISNQRAAGNTQQSYKQRYQTNSNVSSVNKNPLEKNSSTIHSLKEQQSDNRYKNQSTFSALDKQRQISPTNSKDPHSRKGTFIGTKQNVKQPNINNTNKDLSILDTSTQSIIDSSYIKLNDSKQQVKTDQSNQRKKNRSHKSLHSHTTANQTNIGNSDSQNISTLENKSKIYPEGSRIMHQKHSFDNSKQSDILSKIGGSNKQKSTAPDIPKGREHKRKLSNNNQIESNIYPLLNQDITNISYMNSQDSIHNLHDHSTSFILKQLQDPNLQNIMKTNPSQSKLNESQIDKKKHRSKTLHDAEALLNRIKLRSVHYQEHQEQINNQISNFNFDKIKQRQIKILQTFKDQKVPEFVKKRLHHDFIDILSMCKS